MFVATNDLMGQLEARQETAADQHSPEKTLLSLGGVDVLARYLEILRRQHAGEVVLLDAGNSLSGTLIARSSGAQAMSEMFQRLGYDAVALAPQDLAAGPSLKFPVSPAAWMPQLFKQGTPVLMSNLLELKSAQPVTWGTSTPQLLKEINGVKVGFMGLLPDDLPAKLDAGALNGLYVEPALTAFLKQSRSLRLKGAEVIVLAMYGGAQCGLKRAEEKNLPVSKVNFDPRDPAACSSDGALARFLNELPTGSVDLVVTGGAPSKVANFINGIPVVQGFAQGTSLSRVELVWDMEKKALAREKTLIHQPVLLCHRFFQQSQDCYSEDATIDHRGLTPAKYLGEEIFPDPKTAAWMSFWRSIVASETRPVLSNENVHDWRHDAAAAVRIATGAHAAVVGGSSWDLKLPAGTATWRDLYQQKGARQGIHTVSIPAEVLESLKAELKDVWWSVGPTGVGTVSLSVNQSLWDEVLSTRLSDASVTTSEFVVADTIISWERDTVSMRASGRSPALPHTQP